MLRLLLKSGLGIMTAGLLLAGSAAAQSAAVPSQTTTSTTVPKAGKSGQHYSAKRSSAKTQQPEVVQPPPPPPTPEQMAPVAPEVLYQGGQLTIKSQNATLAQVLRSVQAKTGGSFEIPGSANSDRVVAQLGPGPPRDVLAKLLDGSKFNYIILGSPTQPGAVQKLILTPRQNSPTTNTAQNRPVQPQTQEQPEDEYTPPEPTPVEDNSANEAQPAGGPYRPGGFVPNQPPQNGEFSQQQPPTDNPQPQQGAKTPEQLLQELQRMQQQQQQYQQQLNPANQNPPPQQQVQPQ
jgi:hypothetical protein